MSLTKLTSENNHKNLLLNSYIHNYIKRVHNRFVFKIKDGYKLELQTLEIMKLFVCTINWITKQDREQKNFTL